MENSIEISEEQIFIECMEFWKFCTFLHQEPTLDNDLSKLKKENNCLQDAVGQFLEVVRIIPLCTIIQKYIGDQISDIAFCKKAIDAFKIFYINEVFPTKNKLGLTLTIDDLRGLGHGEICERIRCIPAISHLEREDLVKIYLNFALDLHQFTFYLIQKPFDPDREKTKYRVLPLEKFWEFSSFLSERDALIAAIMYYSGHQLNEVLSLQVKDVHPKDGTITFKASMASLPRHISLRLRSFLFDKKTSDLLFINRKNEEVSRTHVLTAFKKASNKIAVSEKITPKSLIISFS